MTEKALTFYVEKIWVISGQANNQQMPLQTISNDYWLWWMMWPVALNLTFNVLLDCPHLTISQNKTDFFRCCSCFVLRSQTRAVWFHDVRLCFSLVSSLILNCFIKHAMPFNDRRTIQNWEKTKHTQTHTNQCAAHLYQTIKQTARNNICCCFLLIFFIQVPVKFSFGNFCWSYWAIQVIQVSIEITLWLFSCYQIHCNRNVKNRKKKQQTKPKEERKTARKCLN